MVRIPPHGLFQQNVFQLFGSAPNLLNVPGYLLLNSDQPISGFTSLIDNNSDDPSFAQFLANGSSRFLVPSSTNVGSFRSDLALINLSTTQPSPIQITVRDV